MLTVHIASFSYKSRPLRGVVGDVQPHGGGFIFDCRCLTNPGRQEEYRTQTGRDKAVQAFLEKLPVLPVFLNACTALVDLAIVNYSDRGFEDLTCEFGCTGGQHRSVFCAEWLARSIWERYDPTAIQVELRHTEMEARGIFKPLNEEKL
jgi:RNase adaptor protein for sRNA GlmZ degradation